MARAQKSDFLQNFRFHVKMEPGNEKFVQFIGDGMEGPAGEAGFQTCTVPEITMDGVEYRDGLSTFTRKQPGVPTVGDVTLARGVAKYDTAFYKWIMSAVNGKEYRSNFDILHFHRDELAKTKQKGVEMPARVYRVINAFPTSVKIGPDLDSTGGDVSILEMTIMCEECRLVIDGNEVVV